MSFLDKSVQVLERPYSLQNTFLSLSNLENQMENLFAKFLYEKNKPERVNQVVNPPTNFPHCVRAPQQCNQQLYNVPSCQNRPSCCTYCGAAQLPKTTVASSFVVSSSPDSSSHSGCFNPIQRSATHGSPIEHALCSFAMRHPQGGRHSRRKTKKCSFCFKNGERPCVYNTHELKNEQGVVLCPILRRYVCIICGATGDHAHTRKYCPHNVEVSEEKPLSRRLSSGFIFTNNNNYFK